MEGFKKAKMFMTHEEMEILIERMDSNKNQKIDYSEFIAMTVNKKEALSDNRIKGAFQMFD